MSSRDVLDPDAGQGGARTAGRRACHVDFVPREDAVVFRCDVCREDIHDLRGVFLAHRAGAGWSIECSRHGDAEHVMDGGHLFGGGLRSLELLGDLARAPWFDAADLFSTLLRLRAQVVGLYRSPGDRQV